MNTPNTTQTNYLSVDLCRVARCPGNEIGKIMTDRGVQPLSVRITKSNQHRYVWGEDAMKAAQAWRVEQDARLAAKKAARKPKAQSKQLELPLPDVTETFPTIERRKDDAQLIAIHEQLITLNNTMAAMLAIWTKE